MRDRQFPEPTNSKMGNLQDSQSKSEDIWRFGSNLKFYNYVFMSYGRYWCEIFYLMLEWATKNEQSLKSHDQLLFWVIRFYKSPTCQIIQCWITSSFDTAVLNNLQTNQPAGSSIVPLTCPQVHNHLHIISCHLPS
jgi:hypothetical protein